MVLRKETRLRAKLWGFGSALWLTVLAMEPLSTALTHPTVDVGQVECNSVSLGFLPWAPTKNAYPGTSMHRSL
jgi:hypothetical protein